MNHHPVGCLAHISDIQVKSIAYDLTVTGVPITWTFKQFDITWEHVVIDRLMVSLNEEYLCFSARLIQAVLDCSSAKANEWIHYVLGEMRETELRLSRTTVTRD